MEVYTNEDSQELLQTLKDALPYIEHVMKTHKPLFDGERYLTSEELCNILKISRRSLQDYRNNGFLPFIRFFHQSMLSICSVLLLSKWVEKPMCVDPLNQNRFARLKLFNFDPQVS